MKKIAVILIIILGILIIGFLIPKIAITTNVANLTPSEYSCAIALAYLNHFENPVQRMLTTHIIIKETVLNIPYKTSTVKGYSFFAIPMGSTEIPLNPDECKDY